MKSEVKVKSQNKVHYTISIDNPSSHIVRVSLTGKLKTGEKQVACSLSLEWAGLPGPLDSARYIRWFKAEGALGEFLFFTQPSPGRYVIDWEKSSPSLSASSKKSLEFKITYEVYGHSTFLGALDIQEGHANLLGPTYLMAVEGDEELEAEVRLNFPPLWSKVSTSLKDISTRREEFVYSAENYAMLLETPIEIGCHETDGFRLQNTDHEIGMRGMTLPLSWSRMAEVKKDLTTIAKTTQSLLGSTPYSHRFLFFFIFDANNSPTPRGLTGPRSLIVEMDEAGTLDRRGYLRLMNMVAQKYSAAWLDKAEARVLRWGAGHQRSFWFFPALSQFLGGWILWQSGIMKTKEYLQMLEGKLQVYLRSPGRRFCTLEDSFKTGTWDKQRKTVMDFELNSRVDGLLKGELVFFLLNSLLISKGKKKAFSMLLQRMADPQLKLQKDLLDDLTRELGGAEVYDQWETMVKTTEDIDFEKLFKNVGIAIQWGWDPYPWFGIGWSEKQGNRVFVDFVELDSPAFKGGLNVRDEILAVCGLRVSGKNLTAILKSLPIDQDLPLFISRNERVLTLTIRLQKKPRELLRLMIEREEELERLK